MSLKVKYRRWSRIANVPSCPLRAPMPRFAVAAELRCLPTDGDQAQPCLEFPSKNVGTQQARRIGWRRRQESPLMPNRTLAIDLHAHALIPEVEALVHGQEGLPREHEERADWAAQESNDHHPTLF